MGADIVDGTQDSQTLLTALQHYWGCDSLQEVALLIARIAEPSAGKPMLIYHSDKEMMIFCSLDQNNKLKKKIL